MDFLGRFTFRRERDSLRKTDSRLQTTSMRMSAPVPASHNVVELPSVAGKTAQLAKLDIFIMDELTSLIGFENGTYALYLAGYRYIADIVASSPDEIIKVRGMSARKMNRIRSFLRKQSLEFGADVSEWQAYKARNASETSRQLGPGNVSRRIPRLVR
jgi:ERCC4-type nuclease